MLAFGLFALTFVISAGAVAAVIVRLPADYFREDYVSPLAEQHPMALWGDEAAVGLDIVTRSYQELLRPLGHCQVAPVLFLWGERWMFELLGMSEHAMRLLPLLTGLVGLLFFWKLARLVLQPIAAALAVAIAAISHYIVRHSVDSNRTGSTSRWRRFCSTWRPWRS